MARHPRPGLEDGYFDPSVTARERAVFEAGISLGSICHQFVGTPVADKADIIASLEKAIEATMSLQPHKEKIRAKIVPTKPKTPRRTPFAYEPLSDRMLDLSVTTSYRGVKVCARMRYVEELDYPLMYVEKISKR